MLNSGLPPKISAFASISVVSAITGSASGGLQIFMATMAQSYVEMGIPLKSYTALWLWPAVVLIACRIAAR